MYITAVFYRWEYCGVMCIKHNPGKFISGNRPSEQGLLAHVLTPIGWILPVLAVPVIITGHLTCWSMISRIYFTIFKGQEIYVLIPVGFCRRVQVTIFCISFHRLRFIGEKEHIPFYSVLLSSYLFFSSLLSLSSFSSTSSFTF